MRFSWEKGNTSIGARPAASPAQVTLAAYYRQAGEPLRLGTVEFELLEARPPQVKLVRKRQARDHTAPGT